MELMGNESLVDYTNWLPDTPHTDTVLSHVTQYVLKLLYLDQTEIVTLTPVSPACSSTYPIYDQ